MTKIAVLGAGGRMGMMIIGEINAGTSPATLSAAVEHVGSAVIGRDSGRGVLVTDNADAAFAASDVVIDFTSHAAAVDHAALASRHGKPLVVGTTGLDTVEEAALITAAQKAPVFYTANMSLGVNLLLALVEQAAARLSREFDIEIFEAHHRNKTDAPSGTALALGKAAAKGRGVKLEDALVMHTPATGVPRVSGAIGFSVFRGGDVVGEHTVTFAGAGERLELAHKATDRAIFARGAVKAALWLRDKKPGLYTMRDLLGL